MIKLPQGILSVGFTEGLAIALVPATRSDFFSGNSADSLGFQPIRVIMGVRSPPREASATKNVGAKGFSPTSAASNALRKLAREAELSRRESRLQRLCLQYVGTNEAIAARFMAYNSFSGIRQA